MIPRDLSRALVVAIVLLLGPRALRAQDVQAGQHDHPAPPAAGQDTGDGQRAGHEPAAGDPDGAAIWEWSVDANAFVGLNYQRRKFRDFHEVESQNWIMATASRPARRGRVTLISMFSLEPFTIQALGSPQVFQTGETFEGAPLIDYQHPHDLFMALGGLYRGSVRGTDVWIGADLVGAPSVGPPAFMHRPSAAENPQAPLSHHQMDSTHITHGVLRAGAGRAGIAVETSWFRGREPDENRLDLDLGPLDSWAARLSWTRGGWAAQVSAAWLTEPERLEPYDVTRLTASVGYLRAEGERSTAMLAAWGQNREVFGLFDAWLLEGTWWFTGRDAFYGRAELVTKSLFGGPHPVGFVHQHPASRIGALTTGYIRDVLVSRAGSFGVGGDVTVYAVPADLQFFYGAPVSFHAFLRYRPARAASGGAHVH